MMKMEEIDNEIVRQLENNGLKKGDKEQQIKLLLTHVYMAVKMYWAMSREDRVLASQWHKKFRRSFTLRNFLKERITKSRRNYLPPAPPMLKKEYKEKTEKTSLSPAREKRTLKVRQEAFWNELLTFEKQYDLQMLRSFYYYWAEQVTGRRKMRLELETSWDTQFRLAAWSKRSFNKNDEAAAIRLERAKNGGKSKPAADAAEQQAIAAKRAEDNARLELEIKARKEGAVSYEEYARRKNKTTT